MEDGCCGLVLSWPKSLYNVHKETYGKIHMKNKTIKHRSCQLNEIINNLELNLK